jgi:long-chain acyl-CoA synthetase
MCGTDEDGYFYMVDRKKDMITRGRLNVCPREIEEVIYEHPAVAEAARRRHDSIGGCAGAAVALKYGARADPHELKAFVTQQRAAHEYARTVWFLDALPAGPAGKNPRRENTIPPFETSE